jgi:hypothetical protein
MTQQGTPYAGFPGGRNITIRYNSQVSPEEAIRALCVLAARAGVDVRIERFEHPLAGKGGLCRIDGMLVVLVDANLGALEQAGVIGGALAELDLEGIAVPAEVRTYLRTGHGEVKALLRPRPLARVK